MPHIKCDDCSKEFYKKPSHIEKSNNNYCSIQCYSKAKRRGKYIKCYVCKKETYKMNKDIKRNQSNKFFCSMDCSLKWRNSTYVGSRHPNWKTGKFSYRNILKRSQDVNPKCLLCGEKREIILAVHHVDKDRRNNKTDNLVWLCHNCHFLVHHHKREQKRLKTELKKR